MDPADGVEFVWNKTGLFVEQSRRGSLAIAMRDTLAKLEPMIGYYFKVVESGGSKLGSILELSITRIKDLQMLN